MGHVARVRLGARVAGALTLVLIGPTGVTPAAGAATPDVFCSRGHPNALQSTIDGARSGDTIRIHGVCVGNFAVPGTGSATRLTLQGVGSAVLNGASGGATLLITGGVSASVRDLAVTGGTAFEGGGIFVSSGSLTLTRSTVFGNSACLGGGIALLESSGTINASVIRDNTARDDATADCENLAGGGGVEVDHGSTVAINSSTIAGNRAGTGPDGFGVGGGMDLYGARVRVVDSIVRGNRSAGSGGGISSQFGSTLSAQDLVATENSAGESGGALIVDGARATVVDSTLANNRAQFAGGAILNFADAADVSAGVSGDTSLSLLRTTVHDNTAQLEGGGGILNYGTNGHDAVLSTARVDIHNNSATNGDGGGIWNIADPGSRATATLDLTLLRSNKAQHGGGLDNHNLGVHASVVLNRGTSIIGNTASVNAGGVYNQGPAATVTVRPGALITGNRPNNCVGCS